MPSIKDIWEKSKGWGDSVLLPHAEGGDHPLSGPFYVFLICTLSLSFGFGLGRLSKIEENKVPVRIERASLVAQANMASMLEATQATTGGTSSGMQEDMPATVGMYVASRNGTRYHLPWCSGAQRINEENKIWFATKEEAERAGYTPAANCKGI